MSPPLKPHSGRGPIKGTVYSGHWPFLSLIPARWFGSMQAVRAFPPWAWMDGPLHPHSERAAFIDDLRGAFIHDQAVQAWPRTQNPRSDHS